jgi:glycosyltransferase involved in cell wall biosynthesis
MNLHRVAVFRNDILPLSETFIHSQVKSLQSWQAVLVGQRRVTDGLSLDDITVSIIAPATNRLTEWLERLGFWLNFPIPRLVRAFKSLDVDLVHAHFGTDATDIWPSVRAAGLPMLVTLHGYDINIERSWWERGNGGMRRRNYPKRLEALSQQGSVRFIAVSEAIRRTALVFGIPAERIDVRFIGIDTEKFHPGPVPLLERPKRVLFVGRLVEKKGAEYLIRAFRGLQQSMPEAELVIAGDGPERESLQAMAAALGVRVLFLGSISNEQVLAQMHHSRIFCLPSVRADNGDAEGLPIAVLEAAACGLGIATSANGAVGEAVVHGESGICFPERQPEVLCDHLLSLLSNDDLLQAYAAAARAQVLQSFELRACSSALEALYTQSIRTIATRAMAP